MTEPSRYAQEATATIRQREGDSRRVGAPYIYLDHATTRDKGQSKEDLARQVAAATG